MPAGMRADLVETEQNYLGRRYVIYKNPIGLSYFRLPISHATAAGFFNGARNFRQILEESRKASRYWRARPDPQAFQELMALAHQLAASGLLKVSGGSAVARSKNLKTMKQKRWFELLIGKVLYFRKSLIDPDKLLTRMLPIFGWMYSPIALVAATVFFIATIVAAAHNWDEITVRAANFFTFENLALTWILFFAVKIVHEFGHGLTCKYYGGEVHEMGFMFILFTPYLYCNVTDSWLARKGARIAVTAAGIYVELILASIATWLWIGSQPGIFHQLCFNTMFICSISTVLFNANPLMKFDGYYIMTDLLEIPNLKQKSNTYVTQWAQRTLLGMKSAVSKLATFELSPWFGIYAVLSYLYGWLILYNISFHLFDALKPYGLEILSRTYVGLFLFTSLALPLYRLAMSVQSSPEMKRQTTVRLRYIAICLLAVGGAMFLLPWHDTIKRTVVIEHAKMDPIVSKDPGFLRELKVHDGQVVHEGDVIARLESTELAADKVDLELQRELSEIRYRAAISSDRQETQLMASAHKKMVREFDEQLKGVNEKIEQLTLRAPHDGIIRSWRVEDLAGQYFTKKRPVCQLGEHSRLRAIIPLNEHEAHRVKVGQTVKFRLFAEPGMLFRGTITSLPVSPLPQFTTPALANLFGGDVPAEADPNGTTPGAIKPSLPHYEAEVTFDDDTDVLLRAGMMGKARIDAGKTTLGHWLIDRALDRLDPGFRL